MRRTLPTINLRTYIKNTYPNATHDILADVLKLSVSTYQRMIYRPVMCWTMADKHAISLGVHPVEIWPEWYEITQQNTDNLQKYRKVS